MQELYLGIMTGTSLDAVDTAVVSFTADSCQLQTTHEHPFPTDLQQHLRTMIEQPENISLDELGSIDRQLGLLYAESVAALLEKSGTDKSELLAIGCHGQTIRHRPDANPAFTMQIGDAATLANLSGIKTVADFRSADVALGGQGAPLATLFHNWLLSQTGKSGAVVNIGGIANISVVLPSEPLIGFDTGPGNTLLDLWCQRHTNSSFDRDGQWAAGGHVVEELLNNMLSDDYLLQAAPKSTGREHFNANWLDQHLAATTGRIDPQDIQATLADVTAISIANAVNQYVREANVWLCGGGAANRDLLKRIQSHCPAAKVQPTDALGIAPGWIEAAAFAWLARARINAEAVGMPSVTGAKKAAVLGAVHHPART